MAAPYITSDDAWMAGSSISYWAFIDLALAEDGDTIKYVTVTVQDEAEDPERHNKKFTITLADLNTAAKRVLDERLAAGYILSYIAERDIDAEALDVVFQIACFGKLIYG
jgi:hypothetical protein